MQNGFCRPVRVLVCDIDKITVQLLAADLRRQEQFEIDCCQTSDSIADQISSSAPAVLLLGVRQQDPASAMLNLLRKLRSEFPEVRAIVLSDACGRELVAEIFRAGAKGFFDRASYDPMPLCRCIQCVADGQIWASSEQLGFVLDAFSETSPVRVTTANGVELLTPREREVVRLVADGFGNREVAEQLGLSTHTVKNYLFNVFDKIGVSSRTELIMYVLSNLGRQQALSDSRSESQ
jgi:DNA-binding NarL/FixJ family response regulator